MAWLRQLELSLWQPERRRIPRWTHWDWERLRPTRRKNGGRRKTNASRTKRRPNASWS